MINSIQEKIVALLKDQGSVPLRYREIGRKIGEKYPQTVKYHVEKLEERKMILVKNGFLRLNKKSRSGDNFLNLPFYGVANCGPANVFAESNIKGFVNISGAVLPRKSVKDFYIIKASGNSMNKSEVGPQNRGIDDGEFVIIDSKKKAPENGDYILSVIDQCANIKRYFRDPGAERVTLTAESSDEYMPIILHEKDNFHVMGTVVDVIKKHIVADKDK